MKQDPGLPLRTRLASSEQEEDDEDDGPPDSPSYGPQDDDEAPMDLRKKPEKEEEKDRDRGDSTQAEQVLNIWQKALFTGMHPYLSLILGGGGEDSQKGAPIFPYGLLAGNGELLTPSTPVICDQFGVRHAVFRTPEGGVTTVPLSGFADQLGSSLKGCRDPEEARSPALYGRSLRPPTSELLSRLQSAPCHRTTYNGTSFREESEPEDLTVNRTSRRQDSENEEDDLRRSKSCSDIPGYPDPEMLDRVRVKSDSESPVSWSTPVARLTSTVKRKVEDSGETSILNSPITRLLDPRRQERSKMLRLERQDPPGSAPPSEQESFLQKLRQAAPVPWNVYSYYTQMMQSLSTNDHEVLRGHLSSGVPPQASAVNSGKSSPSPATTPLSSSPPSANGDSRKNARVLTGKHVRHGTGASPSTLLTLRQKIQERQKAKELACAQSCAQQDSKHKDMSRKRAAGKVRLVKQ